MAAPETRDAALASLAALAEPLRRRLFLYVASSAAPVSREQAAEAIGVARAAAAFHLDKLADVGVLAVEYRRPPGRGGPGAGRPAKLYRAVEEEVAFSVPERHYDLAAAVLARAVADAEAQSVPVAGTLRSAARAYGRAMGAGSAGDGAEDDPATAGGLERVAAALTPYGYAPCVGEGRITLENCPFRALAEQHRELVCQMNLQLLKGVLKGARTRDVAAHRDPCPGRCCVTLQAR
jgi:predicted ArsR family transcriptional regulator